ALFLCRPCLLRVVDPGGDGELLVLLRVALELEELVIAAPPRRRVGAADRRAVLVDRAPARLGIEEAARGAEDLVLPVTQDPLARLVALAGELALRLLGRDVEALTQPHQVPRCHLDAGVRAAVGRAAGAVVEYGQAAHTRSIGGAAPRRTR